MLFWEVAETAGNNRESVRVQSALNGYPKQFQQVLINSSSFENPFSTFPGSPLAKRSQVVEKQGRNLTAFGAAEVEFRKSRALAAFTAAAKPRRGSAARGARRKCRKRPGVIRAKRFFETGCGLCLPGSGDAARLLLRFRIGSPPDPEFVGRDGGIPGGNRQVLRLPPERRRLWDRPSVPVVCRARGAPQG